MGAKTVFVVAITTARIFFPGTPDMPKIPGMNAPEINAPTKTLTMDLTSDKKVDAKSKAECAVPEGLKLGPKVKLTIDLPTETTSDDAAWTNDGEVSTESKKFIIKQYWGCSETVRPGQPRTLDTSQMMNGFNINPRMIKQFQKAAQKMIADADRSHAYWPGMDKKHIEKDSITPGDYELTTNYCGGTTFSLSNAQNFLAPIELVDFNKIDLKKSIKVQWKPVPEAKAYLLMAFSSSEDEMIMWTSSEDPDMQMNVINEAISPEQLKKYLDQCILIPADVTTCSIPAGIFKDAQAPMLMVTAIGADKIQEKDGIETQIVVRSNLTAMLGASPFDNIDGNIKYEENTSVDDVDDFDTEENTQPEEKESAAKKIKKKLKGIFK